MADSRSQLDETSFEKNEKSAGQIADFSLNAPTEGTSLQKIIGSFFVERIMSTHGISADNSAQRRQMTVFSELLVVRKLKHDKEASITTVTIITSLANISR